MVRAYYMDSSDADQREDHRLNDADLSLDELKAKTGVNYFYFEPNSEEDMAKLAKLKQENKYTFEDEIVIDENMAEYEKKIKMFYREHIHSDEEIRYVADGSGYFDLRDKEDKWIRVAVSKGDLLIVPAGIYHRFTLDTNNYIHARRYFVGEPVWTPINRPCEDHSARIEYLKSMAV
ncbi:DgyrCDS5238 [Dimorphilus gyrociliatus]|uniref:Acireductone dioxygenase n=1 Tax=Dimorphilus gyrociliatus TaxID=2664684 RepID=A0A7I8VP37_9ANNE|nr:DgyrCDS5238 [Dimorphilus gyrociliatus]